MRIGLDVDGCIDLSLVPGLREYFVNEHGKCPTTLPDPVNYHFYESEWDIGGSRQFPNHLSWASRQGYIFENPLVPEGCADILNQLRDDGHSLHVCTARVQDPVMMRQTFDLFDMMDVKIDSFTFSQDKTVVDVDLMIEDHYENYLEVTNAGVKCVLFSQRWNESFRASNRIDSWQELPGIITKETKQGA